MNTSVTRTLAAAGLCAALSLTAAACGTSKSSGSSTTTTPSSTTTPSTTTPSTMPNPAGTTGTTGTPGSLPAPAASGATGGTGAAGGSTQAAAPIVLGTDSDGADVKVGDRVIFDVGNGRRTDLAADEPFFKVESRGGSQGAGAYDLNPGGVAVAPGTAKVRVTLPDGSTKTWILDITANSAQSLKTLTATDTDADLKVGDSVVFKVGDGKKVDIFTDETKLFQITQVGGVEGPLGSTPAGVAVAPGTAKVRATLPDGSIKTWILVITR